MSEYTVTLDVTEEPSGYEWTYVTPVENAACAHEAEQVAARRLRESMTARHARGYRATVTKTAPGINRWFW
ncbi:hypothetical protein E1287_30560 [Actinomadura sp. KC06]|uniref:hypothetical protein n=1 Tax=Actinomadura sp. KC06 TaxID=2530369 RepID=UPI00104EBB02|nr:hypothetical protein [Actinomadura sp. KC06]TDD29625.1 hypothetical protein E1287_30560 [Actinomadura sp. KC06]